MKNREYHDLLFRSNLEKFTLKETGLNAEKTFLKLNMPKLGKKSEFVERNFDFPSLMELGIDKSKVMDFMLKKTGKSFEQCHMELNAPPVKMPSVEKFKRNYIGGSSRSFSPAQMLSMRGLTCHLR